MKRSNHPPNPENKDGIKGLQKMQSLYKIIFSISQKPTETSIQDTIDLFDKSNPYSFNYAICQLLYSSFVSRVNGAVTCLLYLKELESSERTILKTSQKIFKMFYQYLIDIDSQESLFLLERMIEQTLIKPKSVRVKRSLFFSHYLKPYEFSILKHSQFSEEFFSNIDKLKNNGWELQKKYVSEGSNPLNLARAIRNDDEEQLRLISSQSNFDINLKIKPSLYERCSFINQTNVPLIEYAAFFGAIKCFRFLMINGADLKNTGTYAIAGGNDEIIHLCEQNHSTFIGSYETAIEFHRNDIFHYIYDNNFAGKDDLTTLGKKCIIHNNYEIFSFLIEHGLKVNENFLNESLKLGNMYYCKYLVERTKVPNDILLKSVVSMNTEIVKYIVQNGADVNMKDSHLCTPLMIACCWGRSETVRYLLEQKGIDVNAKESFGWTAFTYACDKGSTSSVKSLLKQNTINSNEKDELGWTPLMHACNNGHLRVAKILLSIQEIDYNEKDKMGWTALMRACNNGHVGIVKMLLKKDGIDFNGTSIYINILRFI